MRIYWHYAPETFKCEVKAWLFWSLIILPSLRFYVKSNFGECKRSKNVICGNSRGSESWFLVNLSTFQDPNFPKFKVLSLQNCQIWHFEPFEFAKNSISCKIGVAVIFQQSQALTSHFESFWEHSGMRIYWSFSQCCQLILWTFEKKSGTWFYVKSISMTYEHH